MFKLSQHILFATLILAAANVFSAEGGAEGIDVRLVIDVSGSMKANDPANLRQPSVDLMLRLLPQKSRAGIWTFGKWVNMLVRHDTVDDAWKKEARAKVKDINSVGLFTNIGEALEKAAYDVDSTDPKKVKNIILLTDGMVDIDKNPEVNRREWHRIVDQVLPRLKKAGYRIHTIALSDNADRDLMNKLSVATDGVSDVARSADELMKIFLKAFDASAPAEQVPLSDNRFTIDSSVEEFTALIFRKDGSQDAQLIGPDQERLSISQVGEDLSWYRNDKYDLVTVKRPLEGEWSIEADMEPNSRVTVVSNLNLRVNPLPNNLISGASPELSFSLREDGKLITSSDFLSLMDIRAEIDAGDSSDNLRSLWSQRVPETGFPADGVYRVQLPEFDKPGIYALTIKVDGKTFERSYRQQLSVRDAFVADIRQEFADGKQNYILTVNSFRGDVDYDKTILAANIINPERVGMVKPLSASGQDSWRLEIQPEQEGSYRVEVRVRGVTSKGESFEDQLEPLEFEYSLDAGLEQKPKPFFEDKTEAVVAATPEPSPSPSPTPASTPAPLAQAPQGIANWLLYTILGIGNVILLALGFVAYRLLTRKDRDLDDIDDIAEVAEEKAPVPAAPESSAKPSEAPVLAEVEDDEDEPPMEDLDPENDDADLASAEPEEVQNGLDDLDAMVDDGEADDDIDIPAAEDDDMVQAMLKAQGLDLADEQLDDAISSLIDDLESDDKE